MRHADSCDRNPRACRIFAEICAGRGGLSGGGTRRRALCDLRRGFVHNAGRDYDHRSGGTAVSVRFRAEFLEPYHHADLNRDLIDRLLSLPFPRNESDVDGAVP